MNNVVPFVGLGFGLVATGVGGLSWVIPQLLPRDYGAIEYLILGAMITPLMYLVREVAGIGLYIKRRTGLTIACTSVALLVGVILGLHLIPHFGAAGAVASSSIAMWILFVISAELSAKVWFSPRRIALHLTVGVGVLLSLVSLWIGESGGGHFSSIWLCYGAIVILLYWKQVTYVVGVALVKARRKR